MIKVSVIVPVYKVPIEYLRACLDSLTAQTLQECEFIVVSDGAPETECAVCEEYEKKDSRFKFFKREHAGVSAGRNYGIERARGEFVTFVDCDDIICSRALFEWYNYAKRCDSDILISNHMNIPINGAKISKFHWLPCSKSEMDFSDKEIILNELIRRKTTSIPRGACGKVYRRSFVWDNKILFDPSLKIGEDLIFNFKCISKAKRISYFREIFYQCRQNPNSVTRIFDYDFFCNRFAPLLEIKKKYSNKYHRLLGREALELFIQSWSRCYMNPHNNQSFYIRTKKMVDIVNDDDFQSLISVADKEGLDKLLRVELFLFQKRITLHIWFHNLKAYIQVLLKNYFSKEHF